LRLNRQKSRRVGAPQFISTLPRLRALFSLNANDFNEHGIFDCDFVGLVAKFRMGVRLTFNATRKILKV